MNDIKFRSINDPMPKRKRSRLEALGPALRLSRDQQRTRHLDDYTATQRLFDAYRAHGHTGAIEETTTLKQVLDWANLHRICD
jgi:hypothetical protein